jgi:hypothetical protein
MAEYRVLDEKDGIKVEMVVTVDGTVNVGFLITNNRGTDGNVYVRYYDDLGNNRDFQISYVRGDVNKSTGVLYSFSKPNKSFKACFDITKIEDISPYPQPVITEIWHGDIKLWDQSGQKAVLVYPYKDGLLKLTTGSRSYCYIYNWPSLKVHVPPFGGGYQYAVVDVGSVAGYCPDEFTYLTVYPSGGDYWVTERRQRKYVDDFCFTNWGKTVMVNMVKISDDIYLEGRGTYTGTWPVYVTSAEITLNVNGKILSFGAVVAQKRVVYVYHNDVKVAEISGAFMGNVTITRDFRAGDRIKFENWAYTTEYCREKIYNIQLLTYSFNDVSDTMSLRVIYRTWTHKVDIKAYGVPEEFADEYVAWLRSRGVNAVKINPLRTESL